jgi:hypothetical protein
MNGIREYECPCGHSYFLIDHVDDEDKKEYQHLRGNDSLPPDFCVKNTQKQTLYLNESEQPSLNLRV